MSGYPPQPAYGAYEQPPAGYGYQPQQPYYPPPPQPGFQPGQPTVCQPAGGGYYPGQPIQPPPQTIYSNEGRDGKRGKGKIQACCDSIICCKRRDSPTQTRFQDSSDPVILSLEDINKENMSFIWSSVK
ncbi:uncharacterized protein LOC129972235 isoform X1 [Argiope bruennichi]|uniref:uncharacterized protein LOC129972235 isoform X1 n=1 Tax=Argiope bruennichi TaxID=94029 RepID=UPI0024949B22|nr:uncharacterized protein LOC129972235 isoform X1 [Argiope bruennichi]XP_055942258.1 uncharacterized protein LOC129972235 isoform X1 [Argiope bruennichi]XP_055942259.1 uncharacterized protein LOC129972235 isoform X1 [Argiope bruennichi]